MTAYKVFQERKKSFSFQKKEKANDIVSKFRITSFAMGSNMYTKKGLIKFDAKYDHIKQRTVFQFDNNLSDDLLEEVNDMSWILDLTHSKELLLDKGLFDFSYFINMERFLVSIKSQLLQVDPIVFCLNGIVFVSFELIDFNNSIPLDKDDIHGRANNFCLIPVEGIKYFGEDEMAPDTRKIADIIFDNLDGFLNSLPGIKFHTTGNAFLHNLFVVSNKFDNVSEYFSKVVGAKNIDHPIENLNTNDIFEYFSQPHLGIATSVDEANVSRALFDCQLLEALKMYFYINQYVNFDQGSELSKTIDNQLNMEGMLISHTIPIITVNAIENIKNSITFKLNENAIKYKISYLTLIHERKKNKNATLLNFLLYILAFIGGISALDVLHEHFCWPFDVMAIILAIIFIGLGVYWGLRERID